MFSCPLLTQVTDADVERFSKSSFLLFLWGVVFVFQGLAQPVKGQPGVCGTFGQ